MPAFIRRRADDLMHRGGLRMSSATIQFEHGQRPSSISVSLDKASVTAWSPEYHSITNDPENRDATVCADAVDNQMPCPDPSDRIAAVAS
jgi:hypothetical protein